MHRAFVAALGLAVAACGGPSSEGQGAKTPEEILAEQEALGAEQEQQRKAAQSESDSTAETDLEKGKKFDKKQATLELKRAARSAATCPGVVDEPGPGGEAVVNLTFASDGHVKASTISSEFENTKIGKCVLRALEAVIVPAYVGDEVSVEWKVELEAYEGKKDEKKKK